MNKHIESVDSSQPSLAGHVESIASSQPSLAGEKMIKRLDKILEYENDDFFDKIGLKDHVVKKLLDYQFLHVLNLVTVFTFNHVCLDGSDPGTGKTYTGIAVCDQMVLRPLIICPMTLIPHWKFVCDYMGVIPFAIVNYELIKTGQCLDQNGNKIKAEFLEVDSNQIDPELRYKWNLPRNVIIIFDEVHKCKNPKTDNGKLLLSTKITNVHKPKIKVLMLSATISEKPESFCVFGYMLGCYNTLKSSKNWINGMLREDKNYIGSSRRTSAINRNIYPDKGSRMTIDELGDKFPANQISAECYDLDKQSLAEVNKAFAVIKNNQTKIKANGETTDILKHITSARQKIEILKIPIFAELISDALENNCNVLVFVNYLETLHRLASLFKNVSLLFGGQDIPTRNKNVEDFQQNKTKIMICTSGTGSEGISCHDLYGVQRISLISPPQSGIILKQELGRIYRVGAKTPALQRIVYCNDTCEQVICNRLKEKLEFLNDINDDENIYDLR